jgi:hypothetical protein
MTESEKRRSDFEEILAVAIIVVSVFFAFTYFLTAVLGPAIFFFTSEGAATSVKHLVNGLPIWLFVVISFYIPVMPTVGEVFLFLATVFFLCLLAAWRFRQSFHKVIRKSSSLSISRLFDNFLVALPIITSMLLVAVFAIISLQSSAGYPTTPPEELQKLTPFDQIFQFSYAALIEEIGFRISPIGLFLIIRMFEARMRNGINLSGRQRLELFFTALVYPDRAKRTVGLKTVSDFGIRGGISRGEWIMIFLTAFTWGLIHALFGWSAGKFTSVFVDGLVFGLVYIAYGAYAPILLHWFFNYYLTILDYDFSMKYYPYLLPISFLAILLMFAIGIAGWIGFAIIGVKKLLKMKTKQSMPPPPPPLDQT